MGVKKTEKSSHLLGDLLLDAGFIKEHQFKQALEQCEATGLPIGRTLVLSGFIPDGLLAIAINAQLFLRDKKVTRDQVVQSLKAAASRQMPIEIPLAEKGYYALPPRQSLRLGELLLASGVVSEQDLMTALELGLANNKPVGQVLVDLRFLDESVISAALDLQKRVVEQTIKLEEGTRLLSAIHRDGIKLQDALNSLQQQAHPASFSTASNIVRDGPSFPEFLELTKNLDKKELQRAMEAALLNAPLVAKILETSGAVDKSTLQEAYRSYQLLRQGRLPLEQACIVLDYCKRNKVSTDEALKSLNWQQKDQEQPQPNMQENDIATWVAQCKTAYAVYELGDYDEAEKQWSALVKRAKDLGINDLRLPRALEILARVYEHQDKLDKAIDLAGEALRTKRRMFAANHFETATSLNHMAGLAYKRRDLKQSEEYSRRYLKMLEVLSGPDHPNVASALDNLALTCHLQKRFDEAATFYERALKICTSGLGENHPTTVRVLRKYAATLRALKRDSEADHFDSCAMSAISGSWKTIGQPSQESLF